MQVWMMAILQLWLKVFGRGILSLSVRRDVAHRTLDAIVGIQALQILNLGEADFPCC
jgi:hypothetical protein